MPKTRYKHENLAAAKAANAQNTRCRTALKFLLKSGSYTLRSKHAESDAALILADSSAMARNAKAETVTSLGKSVVILTADVEVSNANDSN